MKRLEADERLTDEDITALKQLRTDLKNTKRNQREGERRMALITHVGSFKILNYNQSVIYLTKQHYEVTDSRGNTTHYDPIYDETGELLERENYLTYLQSDGTPSDVKKLGL